MEPTKVEVGRVWCPTCAKNVYIGEQLPCSFATGKIQPDCTVVGRKAEWVSEQEAHEDKRRRHVALASADKEREKARQQAEAIEAFEKAQQKHMPDGCWSQAPYDEPFDDRQMKLPTAAEDRKALPICTGVLDYFPRALTAIAALSKAGSEQHNPGKPLAWDKTKSTDHADCILRHLIDRGTFDVDGQRHSTKVAWRALALLETELENE